MNNNILFNQMSLEELINMFATKVDDITTKFEQITEQLKKVDNNPDIWLSNAQDSFKTKKDIYINQLPETINELNKQLQLLRLARDNFSKSENVIESNIDQVINDLN